MERRRKADERGERGPLVGSRNRKHLKAEVEVPINLEHVLLLASKDPELRAALLRAPNETVHEMGLCLRSSERATLGAIPKETLAQMIDRFAQPPRRTSRWSRQVAATVAGTVMVTATSCSSSDGVDPDPTPYTDAGVDSPDDSGGSD